MERQKNTDTQEMQKEILDIRKEFEEIREAENFLEEETEINEGMVFKANHNLFECKYKYN